MDKQRIRAELREHGWAIAHDVPIMVNGNPDLPAVLALASLLGHPSARDGGMPVWPLRPSVDDPSATFSVRAGSAALHTDSQYHPVPERLVCLFVVRPALDGGHTLLLPVREAERLASAMPARTRRLLAEPRWSWQPPNVFAQKGRTPWRAAVLPGNGTIRWRFDTLSPQLPKAVREAGLDFAGCLAGAGEVIEQRAGDLLVIDNHRVMHGRTRFQDPERFLLRVRLWT